MFTSAKLAIEIVPMGLRATQSTQVDWFLALGHLLHCSHSSWAVSLL